ncbi:MAG: hypothetical protein IJV00_00800 [Clostridia bacterium]|nr:hypothetical protein [Clostridia bacterium]
MHVVGQRKNSSRRSSGSSELSGFQRGRIEYALISDEDKQNILRNNALRPSEPSAGQTPRPDATPVFPLGHAAR